ncbi:MAG TPA: hypothetical protein VF472_12370 [Burkholderiaceae bacterium]
MEVSSIPVEAGAPDQTFGKVMAQITFYENGNGTMGIEPLHVGEFDPNNQCHRLMGLICEMLPQIVQPANAEAELEPARESTEAVQ